MRKIITAEQEFEALHFLDLTLTKRFEEKGRHACASIHEVLGVVDEEHYELTEAVQSNDHEKVIAELTDLAVACLWGIASIKNNHIDW